YANPNLKWETVGMTNIGVDFGFFGNRLTGSVEYFRKIASDLYGFDYLDYTTGISSINKNAAKVSGNGLDLQLNSRNIVSRSFLWYTTLNFSIYRDIVSRYQLLTDRASYF